MDDRSRLNAMAEAEIEALQQDGCNVTSADIVMINALSWRVQEPESRRLLARGVPVFVGGVTLWPLTLYADDWYDRVGVAMARKLRHYALAYAMANGRDGSDIMHPGKLDCEGRMAAAKVWLFARRLRCTRNELIEAMAQIVNQDKDVEQPPDEDARALTRGDLSATLSGMTGISAEFWERQCAVGYTFATLDSIMRQNQADGKASIDDPRIRAERALGWAIIRIRNRSKS